MLRLWRRFLDRLERVGLGAVRYYRRRGAKIGNVGLFSWPTMA